MKLGTIQNETHQSLIFRIDDNLAITADNLIKAFDLEPSFQTMQEFIVCDDKTQKIINDAIEEVTSNPEYYSLINLSDARWLAPNPEARKILGVAFNNKGIRKEAHFDAGCPNYFLKSSSCLNGHNEPVLIREFYGNTIPEPELCLFIGKTGKDIHQDNALSLIHI